jgi:hypothetical protein
LVDWLIGGLVDWWIGGKLAKDELPFGLSQRKKK